MKEGSVSDFEGGGGGHTGGGGHKGGIQGMGGMKGGMERGILGASKYCGSCCLFVSLD